MDINEAFAISNKPGEITLTGFHFIKDMLPHDFDDRPFDNLDEMHSTIKEKWNKKVTNGDTVYILGDMAMRGTQEDLIAFVSTLKGHKIMVRGNHDDIRDLRYKQMYDAIYEL